MPVCSICTAFLAVSLPVQRKTAVWCHRLQMEANPTSPLGSVCQPGSRTFRSVPSSVSRVQAIRRSWPVESFDLCTFPADLNWSTLSFLWASAGADKGPLCMWNESDLRIGCYYGRDNESASRLLNVGSKGFVNLRRIMMSSSSHSWIGALGRGVGREGFYRPGKRSGITGPVLVQCWERMNGLKMDETGEAGGEKS